MTKTVLVVDDYADFLELLDEVLTPEGYSVVRCQDPGQAYPVAQQTHPDVILLDLVMPVISGWQVIEQLKADPLTAGIRIIVCTAAASFASEQAAQLRRLGCNVLLKPFEIDDLLQLVAKAARRCNAC